MNQSQDIVRRRTSTIESNRSIESAKAALLDWAEECDARRGSSNRRMATVATTGMLALVSGMVIARIASPKSQRSGRVGGLVRKVIATLIFRAIMSRVQRQIRARSAAG